jgi:hypothetical protein
LKSGFQNKVNVEDEEKTFRIEPEPDGGVAAFNSSVRIKAVPHFASKEQQRIECVDSQMIHR